MPRHRYRPWIITPLAVAALGFAVYRYTAAGKHDQSPPPAVPVTTARVSLGDFPVRISALGSAQAWQAVVIRAQVSGKLLRVAVGEGSEVQAGSLVAEIDPTPYRAQLMQAQGALARDQAQLQTARLDLERYQRLAAQGLVARQQADTQAAVVQQLEGTVTIDRGLVANAQANLNYTRITAPLSGQVGVRLIDAGNIVSPADATGIVSINQISPMAVTLSIPEGDYQRLSEVSQGFRRALVAEAFSQESGALLDSGQLNVSDNHVDPSTGTVQLKAKFANQERRLWPGQFVNVRVTLQTLHAVIVVPSAAVSLGPKGTYAYVVGADRHVVMQPVTVQYNQAGAAVIASGLKAGDVVVTDGQMSLRPGALVGVRSSDRKAGAARP
jgi:multidrug efflux system membrane fusion protein